MHRSVLRIAVPLVVALLVATAASAGLSGAIFTTLFDGSAVNANIYEEKEDVYLDGGPGQHAPSTAAGLDPGDYYFQVTDPSGKVLLSTDHISCRMIRVSDDGVIVEVYPGTNYIWSNSDKMWNPVPFQHNWDEDEFDHPELGALTVQLYPFANTPNAGGVYKVWVTPVDHYTGDPDYVPVNKTDKVNGENYQPGNYHGFVPAWSKTDNFKVKGRRPWIPPLIRVRNFDDSDVDGVWDQGEDEISDWEFTVTDPLEVKNTYYTPEDVMTPLAGDYVVCEEMPDGWSLTAIILDDIAQLDAPPPPLPVIDDGCVTVPVACTSGEVHEVTFGKVELGSICAEKFYDRDCDGKWDVDEPPVPGWYFQLDGVAVNGQEVHLDGYADDDGCVLWDDLLPGDYTVTEVIPTSDDWEGITDLTCDITLGEGDDEEALFGNIATTCVAFGTKGYWHNKNGLMETTDDDLEYLNSLAPWLAPSSYFEAGDEPIDGLFENGDPVAAASGEWGEEIAPAGSPWAEQSHFLVDPNADGDPREQLAQQLDAFIMNALHRLDDPACPIKLPDGTWVSAQSLIDAAVAAWVSPGTDDDRYWQAVLVGFNESSCVECVLWDPPAPVYPLALRGDAGALTTFWQLASRTRGALPTATPATARRGARRPR